MIKHRLLAVHDDQIDDNVNEPPPSGFRAVGLVIHLCHGISFPYSPNRATLRQPVKVGPSTGSAPRPRRRLESRKRSLLRAGTPHGGLVSPKEPEPGYIKRAPRTVSFGSIKTDSQ